MLFNSYIFIFAFLPASLVCFYTLSHLNRRAAACGLVVTSLLFYGWSNPEFVLLLTASVCLNYVASEGIVALEPRPVLQAIGLGFAISADTAVLIYYKYIGTLLHAAMGLGLIDTGTVSKIALPLGISFFTFTQIGYLVDVKQRIARDRGFLRYLLFVTFFPHLIAGPILHNREMMPQFGEEKTYRFRAENLMVGVSIFVIGLGKKCLFADPVGAVVDAGFAHTSHLTMLAAWNTALCFSLQLYFDFSGYSDMAIGIARMFNIHFPANFNSPFKATSMIDHWQRWHMTLTRYLALYIYNPMALAINRRRFRRGLDIGRSAQATPAGFVTMVMYPLFVTMVIAGIWHGDGWQFLIFGILEGAYLTINHAFRIFYPRAPAVGPERRLLRVTKIFTTYVAAVIGMVFFRATSAGDAFSVLAGMVGLHGVSAIAVPAALVSYLGGAGQHLVTHGAVVVQSLVDCVADASHVIWMAGLYIIVWGLPNTQQIMCKFNPVIGRIPSTQFKCLIWAPTRGWAVVTAIVACIGILAVGGTSEFVYFQF